MHSRLEIRLATVEDAGRIREIYRPAVDATPISFETEVPTEPEMRRRIEETLSFHPWLVCADGADIAGYAYATKHRVRSAYRWSIDTAVYVHADFRRRGVGRGLYTSLLRIAAAQGHFNAYAGITLPNQNSVALHESVGFKPLVVYEKVGYKLGAWHDVGWWQLNLQAHTPSPQSPRSVRDLLSDPSWPDMLHAGDRFIHAGR